jgi:hypothetical protein
MFPLLPRSESRTRKSNLFVKSIFSKDVLTNPKEIAMKTEILDVVAELDSSKSDFPAMTELSDLQLTVVGGGFGEVVL